MLSLIEFFDGGGLVSLAIVASEVSLEEVVGEEAVGLVIDVGTPGGFDSRGMIGGEVGGRS